MIKDSKYEEMNKLMEETRKCRVYCKCGSSRVFISCKNADEKLICTNCGNYIYKNKKTEFKEKMKCLMKG